jgi:hypothetical protein
MNQPEVEEGGIESKHTLSFKTARLYAQLQLLASACFAVFSVFALLGTPRGAWVTEFGGPPTLVASLVALAASVGFLLRRRWARTFLLGECALLPLAIVAGLLWAGRRAGGIEGCVVAGAVAMAVGSIGGAFAFNAKDVREWVDGP